jgi:hypothetical protein
VLGEVAPHLGEQVGQLDPQRVADGGQDLGAGLLAPALDLGKVGHRDAGVPGDLGQRAPLLLPVAAEHLADQRAKQGPGPPPAGSEVRYIRHQVTVPTAAGRP